MIKEKIISFAMNNYCTVAIDNENAKLNLQKA